jgi:hypothetical protein
MDVTAAMNEHTLKFRCMPHGLPSKGSNFGVLQDELPEYLCERAAREQIDPAWCEQGREEADIEESRSPLSNLGGNRLSPIDLRETQPLSAAD